MTETALVVLKDTQIVPVTINGAVISDQSILARYLSDLARTGGWMPQGAIAETFRRDRAVNGNLTLVSGRIQAAGGITIPGGRPVSSISVLGAATISSTTHQWFLLFDRSGNVLAKTVDDLANAWAAQTVKTLGISGGYTPANAIEAYVGVVQVGTGTMQALYRPATSLGVAIGSGGGMGDNSTSGQSDPASCPASVAVPVGQNPFYAYIS